MRTLFLLLLLANAAFFAYAWFGPGAQANGDAQVVAQQLNPGRIRLLAPEQVSALTHKPETSKPEAPKPDTPKPEVSKTDAAKPATVCLEWGAFAGADAARAQQALEPLALGAKLVERKLEEVGSYWVYIAPLASRQSAAQKASELKRLGITDFFIVADDPKWRHAISLGVFKTEDAAQAYLAALRAKGVRSAVAGARETQPGKTYFQVRDANPALAAKLNQLKQGFPGSDVHECAAAESKG